MALVIVVFRLCCAEEREINSVSLLSPPSLKIDIPARLSRLVEVLVEEGDGLCLYICREIKNITSLEKLPQFRAKAHSSCISRKTEQPSGKETSEAEGCLGQAYTNHPDRGVYD